MNLSSPDLQIRKIADEAVSSGLITIYGLAQLEKPLSFAIYRDWLDKGFAGNMDYLFRHADAKETPQTLSPRAKTALVVAVEYVPHPETSGPFPLTAVKIARYARGEDYHFWLQRRLKNLSEKLKIEFPTEEFLTFTDAQPVLERDLAYRAGLGWFGKNSCLIHPKRGSLFLIGEIYTSIDLSNEAKASLPVSDHCGKCTRCLDACPTQAIIAPRKIDARKCISYLTIENKDDPPEELRTKMGDWLFGCDICQTVCPWNIKFHGDKISEPEPLHEALVADLKFVLQSSNSQLQKALAQTALSRSAGSKLKRNAMIVCANKGLTEFTALISDFKNDPKLGEIATWAVNQLVSKESTRS